jgi:hypothetical protein
MLTTVRLLAQTLRSNIVGPSHSNSAGKFGLGALWYDGITRCRDTIYNIEYDIPQFVNLLMFPRVFRKLHSNAQPNTHNPEHYDVHKVSS